MMQFELEAIKSFIDNLYRTNPEWSENRKLDFFTYHVAKNNLDEALFFFGLLYFPEAYQNHRKALEQAELKEIKEYQFN